MMTESGQRALDSAAVEVALAEPARRAGAARVLRDLCLAQGVYLASVGPFYRALAGGRAEPATVPAVNVRGLTYDLARAAWRAAMALDVAPLIFELAPSETEAGDQPFAEYVAVVLAAAVREGYLGPVFFQGDHFHVATTDVTPVQALCREALAAGMRQIDIDAADLEPPADGDNRHRANAAATAAVTAFIRRSERSNDVVVGGEVGVIGGENTTPDDLRAFMAAYDEALPAGMDGLGKISVQTGTRHGGRVLADGSVGTMPLDLSLVARLSRIARDEFDLPGVVQHGASTLTLGQLGQLPAAGAVEVHLATALQNLVFDHEAFPTTLRRRMMETLVEEDGRRAERDAGGDDGALTAAQRFYHNRWRAWGTFKGDLWLMPRRARSEIAASAEQWFAGLFRALRVAGRGDEVRGLVASDGNGGG